MPTVSVRPAERHEADLLLALVDALADYEELARPNPEARLRLIEHGFGAERRFEPYFMEVDNEVVGYAIVLETYSSFLARPTLYLEDLFVLPRARRRGAGNAMLRFLAQEAVRRGCGRMEWIVLGWNELARGVYRKIGAEELSDWEFCRLTGDALLRLAAEDTE
jgi:GNAT superfamily N-acetyltransferase